MQIKRHNFLVLLALVANISCSVTKARSGQAYEADIIVYGGTSAGVSAAVEAARAGKSVLLVSPDTHLGGLSSSGLGFTDTGDKRVIGGLAREFYHRIWLHYQRPESWRWQKREQYGNRGQGTPAVDGENKTMWVFEPHVAEKVFEDLISENKIRVHRNEWLDRNRPLSLKDKKIVFFRTESGKIFRGKVFIDATYEGDLMALAGVSYTVGREANRVYGETWNGIQQGVFQHEHYFKTNIDPYRIPGNPSGGLLPGISSGQPGTNGEGDDKIQAYCYRTCFTDHPENRKPFPRPEGYDAAQYELLLRVFQSGWNEVFNKFDRIPNLKTDVNNHGPVSFDYIGMNYDYPEASYKRRKEIARQHENYQKGMLYFIANDPRVPKAIQEKMRNWGLAADEFQDNENWPRQLYVREARRMIGDYVMTEHQVLGRQKVPEPVGMGSYALDSHHTQRYVTAEGYVQNEGDIGVKPPRPYSISYRSIVPKETECGNLIVPVCISSSHIAYGSVRMEPVFMILGQSAAVAAVLALDMNVSVQDVNYQKLAQILKERKQILTNDAR